MHTVGDRLGLVDSNLSNRVDAHVKELKFGIEPRCVPKKFCNYRVFSKPSQADKNTDWLLQT